ncbi:MAG: cupin domain-containing protein [Gemmatimonadaceae bacterium]
MPVIRAADAAHFEIPGLSVSGLASPSRGTKVTSVWRITLPPETPSVPHSMDKEEIFVALSGSAVLTLHGEDHDVLPGDTIVVPADEIFGLANRGPNPFVAIAVAGAGVQARMTSGERFAPPWTL